jgi:acyl CoA:acetate/3-ketoacid CoA transferase
MANIVFNQAKGRVNEYVARVAGNDPANSALVLVILKTAQADATLQDYATLDAILTAGGGTANVQADFTNYARKVLDNTVITAPTVDDTGNEQYSDFPDQTYTAAGGATNNTTAKLIVCYDPDTTGGTDSTLIPLTAHDFVVTTDGSDIIARPPANGFFGAT